MVPGVPIDLPWESCITIGRHWGYFYDEEYKSGTGDRSAAFDELA
jgi:hypothetical protein